MTLTEIVLATMLALPGVHADDAPRLRPVADAIAEEAHDAPLWSGAAGERRTALVLTAIAAHESGLRESVRHCDVRGDHGRSVGLFQLQRGFAWFGYDEDEICNSDALQAHLALRVLRAHQATGVAGVGMLMRAYASGSAAKSSRAASEMAAAVARFEQMAPDE